MGEDEDEMKMGRIFLFPFKTQSPLDQPQAQAFASTRPAAADEMSDDSAGGLTVHFINLIALITPFHARFRLFVWKLDWMYYNLS